MGLACGSLGIAVGYVYPEEVKAWRLVCERANDGGAVQRFPRHAEAQANKRRIPA